MEVSMNQAALAALWSLAVGAFLGAVYDIIRFVRALLGVDVRNPFEKGRLNLRSLFGYTVVFLSDLLFFLVAAVVLCTFFFLMGDGRMRWYSLCGAFAGFVIYYNTVGKLFIGTVDFLKSLIKKALCFLMRPIVGCTRKIKGLCLQIFDMPIVKAVFRRYNEYIDKRKKTKRAAARRKKARRGGFVNGGTHG